MDTAAEPNAAGKASEAYATRTAPDAVRVERLLPGPIERVWAYLTESDKRAKWLASGPMGLRQGDAVTLTWRNADLSGGKTNPNSAPSPDGIDHVMHGLVTQCQPPHLLAFNWSADGTGTESKFELSQEGGDTRLIITQTRLANHRQLLGVSAGWHAHIGILIDLLSQDTPRHFWPEHTRLQKIYEDRFPE